MIDNASAISSFTAKRNIFFLFQLPDNTSKRTVIFPMKCIRLIGKSQNFFFFFWKNLPEPGIEQIFFLIMKMKSRKEFGEIQETKSTFGNNLFTLYFY